MKLKNRKTGEIAELIEYGQEIAPHEIVEFVIETENKDYKYKSLAELNEEWEDYEGPKEYWAIDCFSTDGNIVSQFTGSSDIVIENRKSIGNYFEAKEEAEKTVEKLKALTEAEEDGLKIKGYYYNHEDLVILADIGKCNKLTLDTLFGKEID